MVRDNHPILIGVKMDNPFEDIKSVDTVDEALNDLDEKEDLSSKEVEVVKETPISPKMMILKKYKGIESDIPINSPYWRMKR